MRLIYSHLEDDGLISVNTVLYKINLYILIQNMPMFNLIDAWACCCLLRHLILSIHSS